MQTENKLNIIMGEWEVKKITSKQLIIGIKGYGTGDNYRKDNHCGQIAQIHGWNGDEPSKISDEDQANAALIADAGTTTNKCGLLPSELLKQRAKRTIKAK